MADTLARYLDVEAGNADLDIYWPAQQDLSAESLARIGSRSFVLQMHLRPHPPNMNLCERHGIALALQWRNLGDVITSFDDHIRRYGALQPVCYVHSREDYLALPDQERYAFLIRNAVPWYLGFYLAWRRFQIPFSSYERMVTDPFAYFREMLERLDEEVDEIRLRRILDAPLTESSRYNVGQVGRSSEAFSDATKRLLERTVLEYIPSGDLEILLWELPWAVPALVPRSVHDGAIVQAANEDALYFVSRGVRRWIPHWSWILSRATLRDAPIHQLTKAELEALDEGAPLT